MSDSTVSTSTYRTHSIYSWHRYQSFAPSHLQSIEHYIADCQEHVKLYDENVMFLRDNITKITGWHWSGVGWPAQNCADTDGYIDVRTGKKYTLHGDTSFYNAIQHQCV